MTTGKENDEAMWFFKAVRVKGFISKMPCLLTLRSQITLPYSTHPHKLKHE